jgi:uncharacterized protein YbjT (DUF2867 family)
MPFTIAFIRAASFLDNYVPNLPAALIHRLFRHLLMPTECPVAMIATEDISGEAARLLVEGWSGRKIVELGSPVSPDDVDRAMRERLAGRSRLRRFPASSGRPAS